MIATKALLLAAFQLVSADVPISVQMFTSTDCSGTPMVQGTAADPLTDAQTLSGTSHPAGMCINSLGGGVSFMGSCPSLATTTMQQWDGSSVTQQGMRYCWMTSGDCSGTCSSSAAFTAVAGWSVPACQSHTAVFGGSSAFGINSVRIGCGDLVNPSPPPSAPTNGNNPCFPSSSIVTKADGTPSRIDALKEGDEIVAATHDGTIGTDTVSLLSIAKPEAEATFVSLVTDANVTISLTPGHHLPIGESCCSSLKTAKDVQLGEKVWAVEAGAIVARTVAKKQLVKDKGLHSPVLTSGGFPVVDGVITSFDSIEKVTLAKHGLAPLLAACKATGTCESVRNLFLGDDRKYIA